MNISKRDAQTIWHPYTQSAIEGLPIAITHGKGSKLFDENGKSYIDAVSSWWVNLHGHSHPYISKKIAEQLEKLHQVIFAGFTHEPAVTLSERLLPLLPGDFGRIFFSDDGSTAVEVALKMTLQYWLNRGSKRQTLLAFENAYHGDTFGAMSVGSRNSFAKSFEEKLFEVKFIPVPIDDSANNVLDVIKGIDSKNIAGFIFEPLIQGAGGMNIYPKHGLNEVLEYLKTSEILLIADEIFTGFGRTGSLFACDQLVVKPDIICLSKGLTGGTLPLGVTASSENIYNAFKSQEREKMLFHGHSFTANPLACTAALASLDLVLNEESLENRKRIALAHQNFCKRICNNPKIENVRSLGTIMALDVKSTSSEGYNNPIRDILYKRFLDRGILLRPLGNILYIVPPYCISDEELNQVYFAIEETLNEQF